MDPLSRLGALALSTATAFSATGLAETRPAGRPPAPPVSVRSLAPLVPLADRDGLTGPPASALPLRGPRLVPTGVPLEFRRLAARVLGRAAPLASPASFPVAGAFDWGGAGARFGAPRGGHAHTGQDVFGHAGTPLLAVTDGVVLAAGEGGGRGNYVAVSDPVARRTYVYLHLRRPANVWTGERVRSGTPVGELGCTGSCSGDHLHFEIRRGRGLDGEPLDPLPDLHRWARAGRPGAR